MQTGIYIIKNTVNSRVYIGSAIDFRIRKNKHITHLNKNIHCNKKLQRFVNKYGIDKLVFSLIELCSKDNLLNREQFYINDYNAVKNGFNILPTAGNWLNHKHSQKTKDKISKVKKGIPSTGMLGKTHTSETKNKISIKAKGRKQSVETIEKRVAKNTGKVRPLSAIITVRKKREILSRVQVLEIRTLLSQGISQTEIAKMYGVCQGVISRVHTKKAYYDVY